MVGSRSNQHATDACQPQCHEVTIEGCFGMFVVYNVCSTVRGNWLLWWCVLEHVVFFHKARGLVGVGWMQHMKRKKKKDCLNFPGMSRIPLPNYDIQRNEAPAPPSPLQTCMCAHVRVHGHVHTCQKLLWWHHLRQMMWKWWEKFQNKKKKIKYHKT